MDVNVKEPKVFLDAVAHFKVPANCINYLSVRRWPNGVECPTCGRKDAAFVPSRSYWQCKTRHPKAQFSIKTGTILEDSPIGLDKWLPVMWLVANCKNGVSSWEIHRDLGVTQKTAWFMLHRIRLAMQESGGKLGGPMGEPVEIDETYIGGKARNMHKDRHERTFRGRDNKTIVMGMLERKGKVRTKVISHTANSQMQPVIKENVEFGSRIHSDGWGEQYQMPQHFIHEMVDHQANQYVNGNVHTNGIENFWSLLKRGLGGTYISVEPFHLFRYLDEQAFRYNNRKDMDDSDRFSLLCSKIVGKRLTYAELTAKESKKQESF